MSETFEVATFRQNVGFWSVPPALWRGAATSHFRPRGVYEQPLAIDPGLDQNSVAISHRPNGFASCPNRRFSPLGVMLTPSSLTAMAWVCGREAFFANDRNVLSITDITSVPGGHLFWLTR